MNLTPMKMLQVVIPGDQLPLVRDLLELAKSGYTILPNVSGMGHHGYHEGRLLFNDAASQVMVVAVVTESQVETIVAGLDELFEYSAGVVFVSDCGVRRYGYFAPGGESVTG